jgi:uncharacterized membrane protein
MKSIDGIGNTVLIIMAAASFISLVAVLSLDNLVNMSLPSYGLEFNYSWAMPYWNMIALVFVMSWLSIITAIVFEVYRMKAIRKEAENKDE